MALTPEERQAINGLFDRMRENGLTEKDSEAEALINQLVRRTPDSAYMLVQLALVQEAQIEEYEHRMDEQDERIRELESQLAGGGAPRRSGGGFLGAARRVSSRDDDRGMYRDDRSSGMPSIGSRSGPSQYDRRESPVDEAPRMGGGRGEPRYGHHPRRVPPQDAQPAGGGGFFRTAAAMAAGVAGGAMLSNALGGMFGGGDKAGQAQASENGGGDRDSHHHDQDNDPGNYDAHDADDDGDWGMDDIEI